MKRQKGFSLIELLIVVAIILIIAAIAIPNLLRSRIAANEASAVAAVRTLGTSEITYFMSNNAYAADIKTLGDGLGTGAAAACTPSATAACLIDSQLSTGKKSGYTFAATPIAAAGTEPANFVAAAAPDVVNTSGVRQFCTVSDAVVRGGTGATSATPLAAVDTCNGLKPL